MKITALSYRTALLGSLVMLLPIGLAALLVSSVNVGGLAPLLYAVLGVAWIVATVRSLLSVRRVWVMVDPTAISWRSWSNAKYPAYAAPTGSVAISEVAHVVITPLERVLGKRTLRGYVPVLVLTDGRKVVLPAWSNAAVLSPQLKAVTRALRDSVPATVTVDATAIYGETAAT